MMSPLDRRKKIFDIQRLETAKMEMEIKIEERLEEIERVKGHIKIQEAAIEKIKAELASDSQS